MKLLDVHENKFNIIAVADSRTHANIKLRGSGVTSMADENGI